MLQKIDGHQYQTCAEYLLDIDLITSNALEYNPNEDNFDRLLRHRACALKDCANSLIKSQLDLDFEKVSFVRTCEERAKISSFGFTGLSLSLSPEFDCSFLIMYSCE